MMQLQLGMDGAEILVNTNHGNKKKSIHCLTHEGIDIM